MPKNTTYNSTSKTKVNKQTKKKQKAIILKASRGSEYPFFIKTYDCQQALINLN